MIKKPYKLNALTSFQLSEQTGKRTIQINSEIKWIQSENKFSIPIATHAVLLIYYEKKEKLLESELF